MTDPRPLHPDVTRPCGKCGADRVRAALAAARTQPTDPAHDATQEKP